MNVKGFGAWPSRNDFQGGQRPLGDPFNKALKGDPFNEAYKKAYPPGAEYASFGMDEYHHYPEQQDLTADQEDRDQSAEQKRKEQKAKKAKMRRMRMMQQVVCLAAGSVVLVSAYEASVNSYAQQPEDPSQSIVEPVTPTEPGIPVGPDSLASWQWSEDNTEASFVITDLNGKVIAEISATVTEVEVPAGCTTEGQTTYTASAQWDSKTFTDSRDGAVLPALGHAFDSGTEVTLDEGQTAMDYTCTRCGEHFVIVTSVVEE